MKERLVNISDIKTRKKVTLLIVTALLITVIAGMLVSCNTGKDMYTNAALGFSMEFPKEWSGKYLISEDGDSISVYHKEIKNAYDAGRLFGIDRLDGIVEKEQAVDTPWPTRFVMHANDYTYIASFPSDVQHPIWEGGDRELSDDYLEMEKDIDRIIESIKAIDAEE